MSSAFDNYAKRAVLNSLMSTLGDSERITYLRKGQDDVTLTAIINEIGQSQRTDRNGLVTYESRIVHISNDPDSEWGGIADPHESDVIELADGETWAVKEIEALGSGMVSLVCVRMDRSEITGQGYRRP